MKIKVEMSIEIFEMNVKITNDFEWFVQNFINTILIKTDFITINNNVSSIMLQFDHDKKCKIFAQKKKIFFTNLQWRWSSLMKIKYFIKNQKSWKSCSILKRMFRA